LLGIVDVLNEREVRGWAVDRTDPNRPVVLDLMIHNQLVCSIETSIYRRDLAAKFGSDGFHGFHFEIIPQWHVSERLAITVAFRKTGEVLEGGRRMIDVLPPRRVLGGKSSALLAPACERPSGALPAVPPKVCLVSLNLNGAKLLAQFFASLKEFNSYPSLEIIIVDHGSTDESEQVCREWSRELDIKFVARGRNYTFSESNNYGATLTDAEYVVFVNNDVFLIQDVFHEMVGVFAAQPDIGIAGIKLLDAATDPTAFAAPVVQHIGVHFSSRLNDRAIHPVESRFTPGTDPSHHNIIEVPVVTGAFLAVRRKEFLRNGGFDEGYNYGYEDVDLCLKYVFGGMRVVCINTISAVHYRGFSRKKTDKWSGSNMVRNRELLSTRFGYQVRRQMRSALAGRPGYWTGTRTTIAFAVTEAKAGTSAGDFFTAAELAIELNKFDDFRVIFLEREENWYNLTEVDVLVVMCHDYDFEKVTNRKSNLTTIVWARNWFEHWLEVDWLSEANIILCSSQKASEAITERTGLPVFYFPIACNPARFAEGRPVEDYRADVAFTGNFWGHSREVIYNLRPREVPFSVKLFGRGWEMVEHLRDVAQGFLPYQELPHVYASTKIVVDDANTTTKAWGSVNSRVFDALSAGCLVITNGALGARDDFDGRLPVFSNRREMEDLCAHFLANEDERVELAGQLRAHVLANHTYEVRAQDFRAILGDVMSRQMRISIKIGVPRREELKQWGDYHFARRLARSLLKLGHSVRIDILPEWYGPHTYSDDAVIVLKGLSAYKPSRHHVNLLWLISHPDLVSEKELKDFDHVLVASEQFSETLKRRLGLPVETMLQCTDPALFTGARQVNPKGGLLFVGNSRGVFRPIVKAAFDAGLPLKVIGSGWESFLPKDMIAATHAPYEDLPWLYASAFAVLNDHWDDMREHGFVNNRVFDVVAAGGVCISDEVPGIEMFGDAVVTYRGEADLRDKVRALAEDRKAVHGKVNAMGKLVREQHSFDARAARINDILAEIDQVRMSERGWTQPLVSVHPSEKEPPARARPALMRAGSRG
jgi:GT2 family glycosyltransferase/spore maturation protein CgeB